MSLWPEEARAALLGALGDCDVRLTATHWMRLAHEALDAVAPLVCAAERERAAAMLEARAEAAVAGRDQAYRDAAAMVRGMGG